MPQHDDDTRFRNLRAADSDLTESDEVILMELRNKFPDLGDDDIISRVESQFAPKEAKEINLIAEGAKLAAKKANFFADALERGLLEAGRIVQGSTLLSQQRELALQEEGRNFRFSKTGQLIQEDLDPEKLGEDIGRSATRIAELSEEIEAIPFSESTKRVVADPFSTSHSANDWVVAAIELSLSSAVLSSPAIAGQLVGFAAGGPAGSAAGASAGTYAVEYPARFIEELQERGVDLSDADEVRDLFTLKTEGAERLIGEATQEATRKALAVTGVEAASSFGLGAAARVVSTFKSTAARALGTAAIGAGETLTEGAGEFAATGDIEQAAIETLAAGPLQGPGTAFGLVEIARQDGETEVLPPPAVEAETQTEEVTDGSQDVRQAGEIYVRADEAVEKQAFGDKWIEARGEVLRGTPVEKTDLPETLYHVTINADAVRESGLLSFRRAEGDVGGLGGGASLTHQGVSLTRSRDAAEKIRHDLLTAHSAEVTTEAAQVFYDNLARKDEAFFGLESGALSRAARDATRQVENQQSSVRDGLTMYFVARETDTNVEDPVIFGSQADIVPSQVQILEISRDAIPDEALIRNDPVGGATTVEETIVSADIPILSNIREEVTDGSQDVRGQERPVAEADQESQGQPAEAEAQEVIPKVSNDEHVQNVQEAVTSQVRLDKASVDEARRKLGFDALPEPVRRRWQSVMDEALATGRVLNARLKAEQVIANPNSELVNDVDRISFLLEEARLETEYEVATKAAADAANRDQHAQAIRDMGAIEGELKKIQQASRLSGTATARSLAALNAGIVRNAYRKGQVILRAKAVSGKKKLTKATERRLGVLADQLKTAEEKAARLEATFDERLEKALRKEADATVRRISKKRAKTSDIKAERAAVKGRLRELGLQVNAGLNPRQAVEVVNLIRTYIAEGVTRTDEVLTRTKQDIPGIQERDVIDALAGRIGERRGRSNAQKQLDNIRSEARLVAKIEDLTGTTEGAPAPGRAPRSDTETLKELRATLNELTERVLRSGRDTERLARIFEKLEGVREAMSRGESLPTRRRPPDPQAIAEAKALLREARTLMQLEENARSLEEQLATGNYELPQKRARKTASGEVLAARARVRGLKRKIDKSISASAPFSAKDISIGLAELPRNLLASSDVGALLRQGIFHSMNPLNAPKLLRAASATLRSHASQESADRIQESLIADPRHRLHVQAGLAIKALDDLAFRDKEVATSNSLIGKLAERARNKGRQPMLAVRALDAWLNASERNMIVGLNVLRAEVFNDFHRNNPNASLEDLRVFANYVNVTTGHGAGLGTAGNVMNRFWFSPRLLTSRPMTPFVAIKAMTQSRGIAKRVARDMAGFIGTAGTMLFLADLAPDWDVETDPEDPDFLKVQMGNTRLDILGGFGQTIRLAMRLGLVPPESREFFGKDKPSALSDNGDFYGLFGSYLQYKLAPSITAVASLVSGKDVLGRETPRVELLARSLTPIIAQEAFDTFQGTGSVPKAIGALGIAAIGIGVSTFDDAFKNFPVEEVIKKSGGYSPRMTFSGIEVSEEQQGQLKDAFRAAMAERILAQRPELMRLDAEPLKLRLQEMAANVRDELKAPFQPESQL